MCQNALALVMKYWPCASELSLGCVPSSSVCGGTAGSTLGRKLPLRVALSLVSSGSLARRLPGSADATAGRLREARAVDGEMASGFIGTAEAATRSSSKNPLQLL